MGYPEDKIPDKEEVKESEVDEDVKQVEEALTYIDELKDKLDKPNKGLRKTDNLINLLA